MRSARGRSCPPVACARGSTSSGRERSRGRGYSYFRPRTARPQRTGADRAEPGGPRGFFLDILPAAPDLRSRPPGPTPAAGVSYLRARIGDIASTAATSTTRKCGICGPRPGRRDQNRGRSPRSLLTGAMIVDQLPQPSQGRAPESAHFAASLNGGSIIGPRRDRAGAQPGGPAIVARGARAMKARSPAAGLRPDCQTRAGRACGPPWRARSGCRWPSWPGGPSRALRSLCQGGTGARASVARTYHGCAIGGAAHHPDGAWTC